MSPSALPQTQHAVVVDPNSKSGGVTVQTDKPLPGLKDDQIMVKVKAIALNPTDFKHVKDLLKPGDSVGMDFSGDIVAIGSKAFVKLEDGSELKTGDAVAGFVRGGYIDSHNAAFQEYVVTLPASVWRVPRNSIPYEDAVPMGGIALSTAAYAMYSRLKLPKPWSPATEPIPVLIWAGSTSVGMYAIRMAKLSNLKVATTASPKHHAYLKSIGADVVYDYKDPQAPSKIKEWSGNNLAHVFDTISEHGSTLLASKAVRDAGGVIETLRPVEKTEGEDWPANVEVPPRVFIYTALLRENEQDFKDNTEWNQKLSTHPTLATELKVMPLKRMTGGLEGVGEGLDYLFEGKASGEKLVYTL